MSIYIILYIYLILKSYSNKKKGIIDIFILLIMILGFGYCIGIDWTMYQYYYDIVLKKIKFLEIFNLETRIEKGYLIVSYFYKKLGLNYEIFNMFLESIFIFKFLKIIQNKTQNISIAVVFMLSIFLFGVMAEPGIRQLIALVLGMISGECFEKKRVLKGILLILLGGFIHKSIYIFLLMILFYQVIIKKINITWKKVVIILVILFFLVENLNRIILSFDIFKQYQIYFSDEKIIIGYTKGRIRSIYLTIFYILQLLLYMYLTIIMYPTSKKYNKFIQFMSILGILLFFLENKIPILFRMRIYLLPYLAIIIGNVDNYSKADNYFKKIIKIIIILISILYFMNLMKNYGYKYIPYKNYIVEYISGKEYSNYYEKLKNFNERLEKKSE